jgi:hypothetical protein
MISVHNQLRWFGLYIEASHFLLLECIRSSGLFHRAWKLAQPSVDCCLEPSYRPIEKREPTAISLPLEHGSRARCIHQLHKPWYWLKVGCVKTKESSSFRRTVIVALIYLPGSSIRPNVYLALSLTNDRIGTTKLFNLAACTAPCPTDLTTLRRVVINQKLESTVRFYSIYTNDIRQTVC